MSIVRLVLVTSILVYLLAGDSASQPPPSDWNNLTWDEGA
jgi:hypothetical protein